MKRLNWFVVPLLLIAIAMFGFSILENRLEKFQPRHQPIQEEVETNLKPPADFAWNNPTPKQPIISNTVVITLTGYPQETIEKWESWETKQTTKLLTGYVAHANTYDEMYTLFQMVTGQNERVSGARSTLNYTLSDNLFTLLNRYAYQTDSYNSLQDWPLHKDNLTLEELEKKGLPFGTNHFTWLHLDATRDSISSETLQNWVMTYQENMQETKTASQLLLCFFPVSPTEGISWIRNTKTLSPFLYWNSTPKDDPVKPALTIPAEDITATLCFSLGLVPPVGCLGKPDYSWFSLEEPEIMDRFLYHTDQFIYSTVYYLNQYQIEDSIIAGYLLEATDTVHATDSANMAELERRYKVILDDFNSFQLFRQKQINRIPSLIWTLLALLSLLIWLVNWLTRYRAYLFGTALFLLFALIQLYVFPGRLSYPVFSSVTVWSLLLNHLIFLLPLLSVLILLFTLMAGYWFNITFAEICHDINGILVTFSVFLLLGMTLWVTRYGFVFSTMMPPLGIQHNQNQFLCYWVLLPVLLGYAYALSFGFSRLLIALTHSREKNP